jgi:pyrroloquinoline quinone biosynthesis protein B
MAERVLSVNCEALLLGSAQDAGVPQAGCQCVNCQNLNEFASCLGLIDHTARAMWMIDATPNFPAQLHQLQQYAAGYTFKGLLLTHAHMGHYLGLAHLGREGMNAQALPVYATDSVCKFLKAHAPWSMLISERNVDLQVLKPEHDLRLSAALTVWPTLVPHRAEFSDTVAYVVCGERASLFYCPDIDRWESWTHDLSTFLKTKDVALLDGTFFDDGELPQREMSQIPHPRVTETVKRVEGSPGQVYFIHLNHTNPLWREGAERAWLKSKGCAVGRRGTRWQL